MNRKSEIQNPKSERNPKPEIRREPKSVVRWCAFLVTLVAGFFSSLSARAADSPNRLDYLIVVTGTELLEGAYPDAHTHFLTRTLLPLGWHCLGALIVDDRIEDVQAAVRLCLPKAPLVIVTGGLGPTENDVTRPALGDVTGIPLAEHPDALAEMERRFNVKRDQLRANLRRQTRVPTRGTYLRNPNGSAVGLVFDLGTNVLVALPGPPRELQPMVQAELIPYLGRRFGTRTQTSSLTLRFVGVGQSQVAQTIKEHVPIEADVVQGSLFEGSRVDFSFSLPDNSRANQARLRLLETNILEHLREFFYADDGSSLEDHVVQRLQSGHVSLAIAEVGTGGSLTASLSLARQSAQVLAGSWVAESDAALARLTHATPAQDAPPASPEEDLKRIAAAIQTATGSGWVLMTGEPRSYPQGTVCIPVVLRTSDRRAQVRRLSGNGSTPSARAALTTQLLDWLRRETAPHP